MTETTFKKRAIRAYELSIADKLKAEDDMRRRNFDVHMAQFVNKLRALKVLDQMPKGWTPKDYIAEVEGVTLMFEPVPSQQVVMPMMCAKCGTVVRKLPVMSMESIGYNLLQIDGADTVCKDCADVTAKKDRVWWEYVERGLDMWMAGRDAGPEYVVVDNT
jgi:hypothetical protein